MRATPSLPVEEQRIDNDDTRQAVPQLSGSVSVAQGRPNLTPAVTIPSHLTSANDGVFANLNAKPERGEKLEDHPPVRSSTLGSSPHYANWHISKTYEQAAADATPPYWETTILTPGRASDEVYVDGLPVGSLFSFFWNGMISMSFQLVGFLLTYLLHTTHAAKNGSKAGLGITMVQYGFLMRGSSSKPPDAVVDPTEPQFPNAHDFDPAQVADATTVAASSSTASSSSITSVASSEWLAYALMIVGWFILIRSVSDFLRARRHEQLVLQSPDRGLGLPVVAEGERSETAV